MDKWEDTKMRSRRRIVIMKGSDGYFNDRIRRWWFEFQPQREVIYLSDKSDKDFIHELGRILMPGLFSVKRSVVSEKWPKLDLMEMVQKMVSSESSFLIYLDKDYEVPEKFLKWVKRQGRNIGYIDIDIRSRYDRRKYKWVKEIVLFKDLILDDKAIRFLLEWSNFDLNQVEAEVFKLSMIIKEGQIIGAAFLQSYLKSDLDRVKELDRLAGGRMDSYFRTLGFSYLDSSAGDRKKLLNDHMKMVETMRLLLLYDSSSELPAQYEKLKKIPKFPMSEAQFKRMVERTRISKFDCAMFLSKSNQFIQSRFLRIG